MSTAASRTSSLAGSFNQTLEEKIRLRAYEIYLHRGATAGNALEDWLRAESEIASVPVAEAPVSIAAKRPRARKASK